MKNEERYITELQTVGARLVHTTLVKLHDLPTYESIVAELVAAKENNVLDVIDKIIGTDGAECSSNQPLMVSISSLLRDVINEQTIERLLRWGILERMNAYLNNSNPVIIFEAIMVIRSLLGLYTYLFIYLSTIWK